jgi:protein phosphatase
MKIYNAAVSDIGLKRKVNEDSFFVSKKLGLFLLADGMGGHLAGDVASKIACDTVSEFVKNTSNDREVTWPFHREETLSYSSNKLMAGIKLANKKIINTAKEQNLLGMGTTIASLYYQDDIAHLCNLGDSRIYRIRDEKIEQLSEDHSLLADTIKNTNLTENEIEAFPFKNVITRALGIEDTIDFRVSEIQIKHNDYYLLCTDGLTNHVSNSDITKTILEGESNLLKTCKKLITNANNNGGLDNITVILVKFIDEEK